MAVTIDVDDEWRTLLASLRLASNVHRGSCDVIVGPMGSGKSLEAMRRARRYPPGEKVLFLSSETDTRSKDGTVESRAGCAAPAFKVKVLYVVPVAYERVYASARLIVIDEAQFFQWEDLLAFVRYSLEVGKDVVVAGLDSDALQRPYLPLAELVCLATHFVKLTAVCGLCNDGTEAGFTIDTYLAVCSACLSAHRDHRTRDVLSEHACQAGPARAPDPPLGSA